MVHHSTSIAVLCSWLRLTSGTLGVFSSKSEVKALASGVNALGYSCCGRDNKLAGGGHCDGVLGLPHLIICNYKLQMPTATASVFIFMLSSSPFISYEPSGG